MRMSEYFDSCEHIVRHCQTWIMECQLSDLETEPGWSNILGTWGLGTTQCVVGSTHWVRSAVLHRNCIKEWLLFFNSIKCENEAAKIGKQICMKVQIWIVKMKSRLGRRKVFGQREVPGVVVPRQHSHRPGASPAGLPCPNFRGQKVHGRCPVRWSKKRRGNPVWGVPFSPRCQFRI